MKKLPTLLMCLILTLSLTACGELPEWTHASRGWEIVSPDGVEYNLIKTFEVFDGIRVTRGKAIGTCKGLYTRDNDATIYEFDENSGAILIDWGSNSDSEHHRISIMAPDGSDFYEYRNCDIGGIAFMPWMEELKTDEFYDFSKYVRKHGFTGDEAKAVYEAIYSTDIIDYNDYYETEIAGYLIFYPEETDSFCFLVEVSDTVDHGLVAISVEISRTGEYSSPREEYWRCANHIPDDIVEKLGITTDIWG